MHCFEGRRGTWWRWNACRNLQPLQIISLSIREEVFAKWNWPVHETLVVSTSLCMQVLQTSLIERRFAVEGMNFADDILEASAVVDERDVRLSGWFSLLDWAQFSIVRWSSARFLLLCLVLEGNLHLVAHYNLTILFPRILESSFVDLWGSIDFSFSSQIPLEVHVIFTFVQRVNCSLLENGDVVFSTLLTLVRDGVNLLFSYLLRVVVSDWLCGIQSRW